METKYDFNWDNLTPADFALYREHMAAGDYNWDICGQVRVGELCFDFIVCDPCVADWDELSLEYNCYVGGVGNYGHSSLIADYPYEEAGGGCLPTLCTEYGYDEFKALAEDAMADFIEANANLYDVKAKALKPLLVW